MTVVGATSPAASSSPAAEAKTNRRSAASRLPSPACALTFGVRKGPWVPVRVSYTLTTLPASGKPRTPLIKAPTPTSLSAGATASCDPSGLKVARDPGAEKSSVWHHRDNPRVVLLTPGPYNETYFEHAFLAQYLGYTLVEGGDLTVRGDRVFLKLLGGLQPVDVILPTPGRRLLRSASAAARLLPRGAGTGPGGEGDENARLGACGRYTTQRREQQE